MSYTQVLKPQFAWQAVPELPYVLRTIPMNDPLLARLSVDHANLCPVKYKDGYALQNDIRRSWLELEKGLLLISDHLLTMANTDEAKSILRVKYWPDPWQYGYRDVHKTHAGAYAAIRKSRTALTILTARCSMAVALWIADKPNPDDIPSWVRCLHARDIPSSWIDALQASAITDFTMGRRVGVVISPEACQWNRHITCYRRAKVPLLVRWSTERILKDLPPRIPYLVDFVPPQTDLNIARNIPPRKNAPSIYCLCWNGKYKWHPYNIDIEAAVATKPSGPFQRAGESLQQFLARMKTIVERIKATETPHQKRARLARLASAADGDVPPPWSRVYMWLKMRDVFPDVYWQWRDFDYRVLVPHSAVRGLWATHPPSARYYNDVFDEWDLCMSQSQSGMPVVNDDSFMNAPELQDFGGQADLFAAVEQSLYPPDEPTSVKAVILFDSEFVYRWYGLMPATTTYSNVDYAAYNTSDLPRFFGLKDDASLTDHSTVRKVFAGWMWHMLTKKQPVGPAMEDCWDLHYPSTDFLITPTIKSKIFVDRKMNLNGDTVYEVRYAKDPTPRPWVLVVSPRVFFYLLRLFPESVSTSVEAVRQCIMSGVRFNTVHTLPVERLPDRLKARLSDKHASPPILYRPSTSQNTLALTKTDYHAYRVRALAMLQETQIRAALSGGGIVWRLTTELLLSPDSGLFQLAIDLCTRGPVVDKGRHTLVEIFPRSDGHCFVDNRLTDLEADLLCGVYKRYAGKYPVLEMLEHPMLTSIPSL